MDGGAEALERLVREMWAFVEANPCSGLSAVQLGVPKRVCLSLVPPALVDKVHIAGSLPSLVPGERDHFGVFINPQIVALDSELVGIEVETCVSLPGVKCIVPRAIDVSIRYQTLHSPRTSTASLNGFFARVFQHEIDHLDGILMSDRHMAKAQLQEVFANAPEELLALEEEMKLL